MGAGGTGSERVRHSISKLCSRPGAKQARNLRGKPPTDEKINTQLPTETKIRLKGQVGNASQGTQPPDRTLSAGGLGEL